MMVKKIIVSLAAIFIGVRICLALPEVFRLGDAEIPIIDGLVGVEHGQKQAGDAKIATYIVSKPFQEVCAYYEAFLRENNFSVIGGIEGESYNASVKKDNSMFTLRIFRENENTVIQFIW